MKTIKLMNCNDSFEANLIKAKLEDAGIPCFLTNENFSSLYPLFPPAWKEIQVMIREEDLEKAIEILKNK
jgi:hypothetical protein